jgi:nitrogen regulatory protein PII-like uncharacterized protein
VTGVCGFDQSQYDEMTREDYEGMDDEEDDESIFEK